MTRMPFPAWDTFDQDPRVNLKPQMIRVYRHFRRALDFSEAREQKLDHVAHVCAMTVADASRCVSALVSYGYLIVHPREGRDTRRFTLAWSVREDLRPDRVA